MATEDQDPYLLGYKHASKFLNDPDVGLSNILAKLSNEDFDTLRDRFADFYYYMKQVEKKQFKQ